MTNIPCYSIFVCNNYSERIDLELFHYKEPFELECGKTLPEYNLAYTTYGQISAEGDNVIWIFHALTANSDPTEWWPGLVGEGKIYDPTQQFIVCVNTLGSCYGSTFAGSINPATGEKYGQDFPMVTIRDIVRAMHPLRQKLGVKKIRLATGGSVGGQQVLEWAIMEPDLFDSICVIGTNAKHSPWGIAFNEAQRMALEADQTLYDSSEKAGKAGMEAARAIALLSYRNYEAYNRTQQDEPNKLDGFRANSYQRYQGSKLSARFHPWAYHTLSKTMDTHDVGRHRGGMENALRKITAKCLVIGIASDFLFPLREQEYLHQCIPQSQLRVIDSPFGHDGFLIEFDQISSWVAAFLTGTLQEINS